MSEDKLTFFEDSAEQEAEEVQEPEQEQAEAEPEQEAAEAEPEETGETEEAASPPDADKEGRLIPVTALLDEREKRQKLEREAEELRKWREQKEAELQRQQRENVKKPDFWENPEQVLNAHIVQVKLEQSRFLAEREYGEDLVAEAYRYFDQHPQESQALLNHPSPFHAAVEHYKRQKFLNEVQDPDQWREQERERIRQELMAEVQQQSSKPQKSPPPSMAKAAPAGRDAIAPGNAFDELFPD